METVNKIYDLKQSLVEIKRQLFDLEDKSDSIDGNYHLQKAQENLILAIGRLDYQFNVYQNIPITNYDKEPSKPYAIGISDICSELDTIVVQNWHIAEDIDFLLKVREYVINSVIWIREELKRLANKSSKIID